MRHVDGLVGGAQAYDAELTTASSEVKFHQRLAATFEGEFFDVTRSYAGWGLVRNAWWHCNFWGWHFNDLR